MALSYSPPEMLRLAVDCGCHAAGVRLLPNGGAGVHYPLQDDPAMMRETLAVMRDTGVGILDLEIVRLDVAVDPAPLRPFFAAGAELSARHATVAGIDPDPQRLTDSFARLCEAMQPFGLIANLEFMPWTPVRSATDALRIVQGADQPNGAILVDALHVDRSATALTILSNLPRERLHYWQICDGPVPGPTTTEALIHAARFDRWYPGEGGIDLAGMFASLPADLPVSVEIPSDRRAAEVGRLAWARTCVAATRRLLDYAE